DAEAQDLLADAVEGGDDQEQQHESGSQEPQEDDPQAEVDRLRKEIEARDKHISKWKNLSRKHETTAKSNSDAARKLKELEDAQKTEQQKLQDHLAEVEVENARLRTEKARADALSGAGLDSDWAEFITEVEPDAALEQAQRLAERVKANQPKPQPPAKPDLKQGARPQAKAAEDPNAWLRDMARGRA